MVIGNILQVSVIFLKYLDSIVLGEGITEIYLGPIILPSKGLLDFTFRFFLTLKSN
jgi:hypothetical protein